MAKKYKLPSWVIPLEEFQNPQTPNLNIPSSRVDNNGYRLDDINYDEIEPAKLPTLEPIKPIVENRGRNYVNNNTQTGREITPSIIPSNPVIPDVEDTNISPLYIENRGRDYINKLNNTGRGRDQEEPEMIGNDETGKMSKYTTGLAGSLGKGALSTIKGGSTFLDTAGDMANKYAKGLTNLIPSLGLRTGLNIIGKYAASNNPEKVNKVLNNAINSTNEYMNYDQMSSGGKLVSDTISAIPQMATFLIPGAGEAVFGATAAGNYADEARQNGATLEQSALKGAIGGLTEIGLQRLLGVIPGYKKLYKDAFEKGISGLPKNILTNKTFMKQFGVNLLREGLEEAITDPVTATADKLIYDKNKPVTGTNGIFDWKQMGADFLGGALLSGMIDLPPAIGQVGNIKAVNKYINEETPKAILFSELLPDGYESKEMAEKFKNHPNSVTLDDLIKFVDVYHNDTIVYNAMDIYSQMKANKHYGNTFDNIVNEQWNNAGNTQQVQSEPAANEPIQNAAAPQNLPVLDNKFKGKGYEEYTGKDYGIGDTINSKVYGECIVVSDRGGTYKLRDANGKIFNVEKAKFEASSDRTEVYSNIDESVYDDTFENGDVVNLKGFGECTITSSNANTYTIKNNDGTAFTISKTRLKDILDYVVSPGGKAKKLPMLGNLITNRNKTTYNPKSIKKNAETSTSEASQAPETRDNEVGSVVIPTEVKTPPEGSSSNIDKPKEIAIKNTGYKVGDKINTSNYGEVTIKNIGDNLVTVTNINGNDLDIGKKAFDGMINQSTNEEQPTLTTDEDSKNNRALRSKFYEAAANLFNKDIVYGIRDNSTYDIVNGIKKGKYTKDDVQKVLNYGKDNKYLTENWCNIINSAINYGLGNAQKTKPTKNNLPTTKADTKGAEYNNTKMGEAGKAAYKKWGENEYVNADLSKPDDPYTQKWTKYFNWWYEKGLSGKHPLYDDRPDIYDFPPFLEDEIFRAGQKDAENKKLPEITKTPNNKPMSQEELDAKAAEIHKKYQEERNKEEKKAKEREEKISKFSTTAVRDYSGHIATINDIVNGDVASIVNDINKGRITKETALGMLHLAKDYYNVYQADIDRINSMIDKINQETTEKKPDNKEAESKKLPEPKKTNQEKPKEEETKFRIGDIYKKQNGDMIRNNPDDLVIIRNLVGNDVIIAHADGHETIISKDDLRKKYGYIVISDVDMPTKWKEKEEATEPKEPKKSSNEGKNETKPPFNSPAKGNKESYYIAQEVKKLLDNKTKFTYADLTKIGDRVYNGTQAANVYSSKDLTDAMELGVNLYLLEQKDLHLTSRYTETVKDNIDKLNELLQLLPTQNKRTEEMKTYQQFSTPPTIAYIASWLAKINENDVVLEPSAGIGGLAVFAKINGAEVIANELDKRRLEVLKNMEFDKYFNENAEQLNNIFPKDIQPSVVIMNPPFSTAASRTGDKTDNRNIIPHITQALKRLQEGGRLVLITGRTLSDNSFSMSSFWGDIKQEYNVKANVGIDGKNYAKYGTNFDVQIIVIDKTGETPNKWVANPEPGYSNRQYETITGNVTDLKDLVDMLGGIANGRKQITNKSDMQTPSGPGGGGNGQQNTVQPPINTVVPGTAGNADTSTQGNRGPSADSNRHPGTEGQPSENNGTNEGNTTSGDKKQDTSSSSKDTTGGSNIEANGQGGTVNSEIKTEQKSKEEIAKDNKTDLGEGIFEDYKPQKLKIEGAKPHGSKLVQSAAMASVEPPDVTYTPNLPKNLITKGIISIAQLEPIVYAGQAHEQILPNGTRKGFLIGDGTGVGKGREIAGIILDNFRQGRKKAVWISKNNELVNDAIAAWTELEQNPADILKLGKIKGDIKQKDGILFASYDTVKNNMELNGKTAIKQKDMKKPTRLQQIVNWVGKDFDGVLVFDESHLMANCMPLMGKRGITNPTLNALAGMELQKLLPKARVVYSSATSATEVSNLGYASRLGLWGKGTEFTDASDFVESVASGGIAAMELIARDMKAQGMYISRNLSYDGVGYETLTHKLTVDQKEIYNSMAKAWEIILNNLYAAFDTNGMQKNGRDKGAALGAFRRSSQSFFNQVITSMQMPTVVTDIEKNLAEGNAVVLQLVNTNEAQLDRELIKAKEKEQDIEDIDLTPREQMLDYLMRSYPVQQYEDYIEIINGQPVTRSRPVVDSNGKPVLNAEAVRMRDEMVGRLASMKIPDSALDYVVNYFGVDNVAEKTGRQKRIVTINGNKTKQKLSAGMKEADVTAFQDDRKRILVFSGAGDTGRSYHADKRVKNQRKRIHYLIQAGWTATRAVQGFGRTHRSNEKQPPNYVLVTTDLKGQKRFISTIARRLDQLGALTKGQRQAGSQGMFDESDNLESSLALDSLAQLYRAIDQGQTEFDPGKIFKRLGLIGAFWNEKDGLTNDPKKLKDMNKFLNNILCLDYDTQNKLFDLFQQRLDTNYGYAKEHDELDNGLENYKADSVEKIQEHEIRKDKSGAKTDYVELLAKHKNYFENWKQLDYPWYARNQGSDLLGIYKNAKSGNVKLVMKTSDRTKKDGNVVEQVKLVGQIRYSTQYVDRSTFDKGNWEKLEEKDYEVEWNKSLEQQPKFTENTLHLITGALLPIWKKLPKTGYNKVIRIKTNEGETYLGRLVQSSMIDETLRTLGAGREKESYDTKDVISKIYDSGYQAELANGWKIVRRLVAGEYRIEVKGDDFWKHKQELKDMGLFDTTIQYQTRYFIPVGDKAEEVFNKVIEYRPITKLKSPRETDSFRSPQSVSSTTNTQVNTTPNNLTDIKSRREIVGDLEKALGIPFRNGRVRGKNVLGTFDRRQYVIREKFADDLDIAAHETGHYLDKLFSMREELVGNKEILRELEGLGAEQSKDQDTQRTEGIAEFVRFYITVREEAQEQAPKFFQYFESKIAKDIQVTKALDRFMENYQKYFAADPEARLLSNISINEHEIKKPVFSKSYTQWIDELNPIQKFVEDITGGETISIKIDSFKQAWLSRGWQAKAMQCIRYGVYDKSGNKTCEGLEEILKPIDNMDNFRKYITSRRALELMERGIKTGLFKTDVKHSIEKYDEKYSEIFDKLQEYQDAILQKLVDSGVLSEQQKADMQELNQDYVPFYRVFENTKKKNYSGEGFANLQTPIKKIKGSTRRIVDPIESIVKNTYYYVNIAERNNVGRSIVELADKYEGSGKYVEKVSPNLKATSFEINDVKKKLEDYGADLSKVNLENILTIFRPIMSPSAKENIVTVYRNGNKQLYQLDPELYRATLFLDNESSSALVRFLNKPTALLRAGAILDPNFVIRNPVRDMFSALVYSNYGFVPIVDTVKGMFHVLKKDDMYQKWIASGGGSSALVSLDRNYLQKSMREMMAQGEPRKVLSNFLKNPIEALRAISEVMEESTRVGEFSKGVEQDGSIEGLLNAALSSRDITIDFARFGTSGKTANKVVAFFNSTIQGPDKMIREFKKNPGRFMWRSFLYVTLPSLIAWLLWHDDDRIKELPAWRKDLFWNIPTKNHIVSIPKPFELGILFGSLPERVLDFIEDEEPEGLGDWTKSFLQNLTPNVFPTAILPVFEVVSNYSFFRESKIANDNLPTELQYTLTTSEMAKKIAKLPTLMGKKSLSPAKVDYFIKGYTAGLGSLGLQIADHFTSDKKINIKDVTQLPGLKGFFSEPYQSSKTVDKFYNKLNELEDKNTIAVRKYKTDNNMTDSEYQSYSRKKDNANFPGEDGKYYFKPDTMSTKDYGELREYRAINNKLGDVREQENLLLNSSKDSSDKDIYKKIYEAQRMQLIREALGGDISTISERIEYLKRKLHQ